MVYKGTFYHFMWAGWSDRVGTVWIRTVDLVTSLTAAERVLFLPVIHSLFLSSSPYVSCLFLQHPSLFIVPARFLFSLYSTLSILFILSAVWLISLSRLFSGCRYSAKLWNLRWITFFQHFPRRRVSAACRKSLCCSAVLGSVRNTDACVHAGTSVKDKWRCVRTAYDGFLLISWIFLFSWNRGWC